jgi:HKD family nuclease
MINVGKQIEAKTPSRSLIMTYCASLPFFERDILPHLQRAGDGHVTVLLDDSQYDASFSDFVTGAGTRYRFHPVRLPHKSANFHPKLFLLMNGNNADLLIGSANLTPSGFRANAEIMDQLTLSEASQEDAPAIAQYVAMLRLLPSLDRRLPNPVLTQLEKFASDLERLGAQQASTSTGPWFLHSVGEALLPQVSRLILPPDIRHIIAISPFFDEKSLAVLKLAETYDKANIRLIKSAEPDLLNGEALVSLGRRIAVEEWCTLSDGQQRRLHAKVLVLRSRTDEWVISGSANLTRSAWLSSAMSTNAPGNVEAVIVRRFALGSTKRLLKSINTQAIDYRSLRRAAAVPSTSDANPGFVIIDAQLCDLEITILLELHNGAPDTARFRVFLEQRGRRVAAIPVARHNGTHVCLSVGVLSQKLDRESPIAATVEMHMRGQQPVRMRMWVAVPATLAFNSSQRNVRAAARDVCRRVFLQDEAAGVIADAITRFLTDLGGLAHDQASHRAHDQKQEVVEDVDRQLSKSEFIITDDALGALHACHARTAQALTGLAALLEKLLVAADELDSVEAPADDIEESRTGNEEEGTRNDGVNEGKGDRKKKVKRAEETLDQLNAAFRETVSEALRQDISERAVPFVLNLPSAAIAYMLLHAQVRRRLELDHSHTVTHDVREILREAFSINGMSLGGCYGWLVRAWASEPCRAQLSAMLQADGTRNDLLAFAAAGLAFGGRLQDNDVVARGILAGLHLVASRAPSEQIGADLQQRLDAIAQSSAGTLTTEELQSILMSFDPQKLNIIPLVRRWTKMAMIDEVNADPARVSGEIAELQRVDPKLWDAYSLIRKRLKPGLAQASATDNVIKCEVCRMKQPASTAQRLSASSGDYVTCDNCRRILIPLQTDDGLCEQIVLGLKLMAGVTSA